MIEKELEDKPSFLTTIFQKMALVSKKQSEKNPLVLQQERQADTFLESGLFDPYMKMLNNGYIPSTKQMQFWDTKVSQYIANENQTPNKIQQLTDWSANGITIAPHHYIEMLLGQTSSLLIRTVHNYIKENDIQPPHNGNPLFSFDSTLNFSKINNHNPLIENLLILAQTDSFSNELYRGLTNYMNIVSTRKGSEMDHNHLWAASTTIKEIPNIVFKNVEIDDYLQLIQNWTKAKRKFSTYSFDNALIDIANTYYAPQIDNKIQETQDVFSDNYFKKITTAAHYNMDNDFSMNQLPQEAKNLLKNIQTQYSNLQKLSVDSENQFIVTNLLEKRIPEVLQKYISITPEYRTTLKNNEGKNAEDLMLESLTNFSNKINTIVEDINQGKVQDLSATKRYSKSI